MEYEQTAREQQSLLQSLGFNYETSFKDAMQTRVASDRQILSCAGQVVTQGQQVTIRLQDENVLVNLKSLTFCGELVVDCVAGIGGTTVTGVPFNALQFFQPQYVKIGNIQLSCANGDVLIQQHLETLPESEIDEIKEATMIQEYSEPMTYGKILGKADGDPVAYENEGPSSADYSDLITGYLQRRLAENNGTREPVAPGTNCRTHLFAVRLIDMFPHLRQIEDMCLFTNHNSVIEFQFITTSAVQSLIQYKIGTDAQAPQGSSGCQSLAVWAGAPVNYNFRNTCLFYQYARLDAPRLDIVLKNEYMLQPYNIIQYRVQAIANAINLTFPVSSNERVHYLMWSFPTNSAKDAQPFNATHLYKNFFSSPTNAFYNLPISLVDLTYMGQRVSIQSGQFSPALGLCSELNDPILEMCNFSEGAFKNIRKVFRLNLSRLPIDLIGSSESQSGLLTVQITLDASSYKFQLGTDYTNGGATPFANNVDCYAFLVKSQPMYLRGGVYSFANK